MLLPPAFELLKKHREAGDLIAIVTATNEFVTEPIAKAFGVETLIAVGLQRDASGAYTGAVSGVPSYQAGKITRVEQWLASLGRQWQDFERIHFYSDSVNDLPLLERVSHPVATNPTPALAEIAQARGWPQLKLFA
jgi:HAD superfamily hydrolase (TIGR01490 family)